MNIRAKFLSVTAAVLSLCAAADFTFEMKMSHEDGIYAKGEPISCTVMILEDGQPSVGAKIRYSIRNSLMQEIDKGHFETDGKERKFDLPSSDVAGWRNISFYVLGEDGKPIKSDDGNTLSEGIGALIAPEEFTQSYPEPKDFDEFWDAARKEMRAIPMDAVLTEVELNEKNAARMSVWDVQIPCTGGINVSGYLAIPKNAAPKSRPALASFHAAGVRSSNMVIVMNYARKGYIAMDVNAHGIVNGKPSEFYKDLRKNYYETPREDGTTRYTMWGIRDKNTWYFRGIYQRVMCTLDYLCSRPEWNGKDLVAMGGSQGGGQSIAAAGLDSRVTLLVAYVPALSDMTGIVGNPPRRNGWPASSLDKNIDPKDPVILNTLSYFDNVNFGKRIKCEAYISTGLNDTAQAPCCVQTFFNYLASPKKDLFIHPTGKHGVSRTEKGITAIDELAKKYPLN